MGQIQKDLAKGSITKNLLTFSFPVFLSCLLQALYGNADAIIVGHFSDFQNITGVTQGSQMMNIVTQMISGFSTGGAVLISQYLGAKKEKDQKETISTLFSIFIVAALGLTVLMLFFNGFLADILALNEEAKPAFIAYLRICEVGTVFIFMYNCIAAVLQAMGDSKHPLGFVAIACSANIILDFLFVAGLKMGAAGAAIATVLAQMLSVILSVGFLRKHDFPVDFSLKSLGFNKEKLGLIFKLGFPYAIQRALVYSSFMAISGLANPYGLLQGTAAGIVAKINTFATIPFSAFNVGISTVAAQNVGRGDMKRANKTLGAGLVMIFAYGLAIFGISQLMPRTVISVFNSDPELIDIAVPFLKAYSFEYILMPFTWSFHGLFSACGYTIIPSIDGILASVVFRTPLAVLFSKTLGMGFPGIAFGAAMAVFGAIVPSQIFYWSGIWKKPMIKIRKTDD